MQPTRKMPLFVITGASGVGKSTLSEVLFQNETRYIVLESDLLWHPMYDKPEENYKQYRELWLNICANVSQIGLPVVLCGCATPEQFERCANRDLVSSIHYLAVVSDGDVLETRMRDGRQIADEAWILSSGQFNQWLKDNAGSTTPPITLLDSTGLSPAGAAALVDEWIDGLLADSAGEQTPTLRRNASRETNAGR